MKYCYLVGKKPSAVMEEIGLSKSLVTRWKSGKGVTDSTAQQIAEYFGVTLDELLGNEEASSMDDELAEELQMLRDREDLRALLYIGYKNTPEQVRRLADLMKAMNEGQ